MYAKIQHIVAGTELELVTPPRLSCSAQGAKGIKATIVQATNNKRAMLRAMMVKVRAMKVKVRAILDLK